MRLVSKPFSKCISLLAPYLSSVALMGLCLLLLGDVREAFQACALHMLSACPSGRGSYSTRQVSVQAQGTLPSVKTSRDVIFSSSAYRNRKFPSCPFLLAENRQLRDRPERPGRTVAHTLPGKEGAVAVQAIFNLFLLLTGSRVSHCFLLSLCLCVSLQLLPATLRCVNYIWPGKSAAGSIFKPGLHFAGCCDAVHPTLRVSHGNAGCPAAARDTWLLSFWPAQCNPQGPG